MGALSTSASDQASATGWPERSHSAARTWRWPKSSPTANAARGASRIWIGGRPVGRGRPSSSGPALCSMIPASSSSSSTAATVGRESPASCPTCVRLLPGRRNSASMTRSRLSSRGLQGSLIASIWQTS